MRSMLIAVVLVACTIKTEPATKEAPEPKAQSPKESARPVDKAPPTDPDRAFIGGERQAPQGTDEEAFGDTVGDTTTETTAPVTPPQATGGGDDACHAAISNFATLLKREGTAFNEAALFAEDLKQCRELPWPAPLVTCMGQMQRTEDLNGTCFKLAFGTGMELTPRRVFNGPEDREGVSPEAGTVDGDWSPIAGWAGCGVLVKVVPPATGRFLVCNDEVIAGPLTTIKEIESLYAEVMYWNSYSNDLRRRIQANWPTGGNYRWVRRDRHGNIVD